MTVYYHGGRGGLQRGSFLLPPTITKARSLSDFGAAGIHRRDRVYVTTSQEAALLYAAGVRNGVIYECAPLGAVEDDPDCTMPGLAFQCERARIVKVIKPKASEIDFARAVLFGRAA